jgi:hypothetical protein
LQFNKSTQQSVPPPLDRTDTRDVVCRDAREVRLSHFKRVDERLMKASAFLHRGTIVKCSRTETTQANVSAVWNLRGSRTDPPEQIQNERHLLSLDERSTAFEPSNQNLASFCSSIARFATGCRSGSVTVVQGIGIDVNPGAGQFSGAGSAWRWRCELSCVTVDGCGRTAFQARARSPRSPCWLATRRRPEQKHLFAAANRCEHYSQHAAGTSLPYS